MNAATLARVMRVYEGSDGGATQALYDELRALGVAGEIAVNVFRAQKTSERAKVYRGGNTRGRYKAQAYERKQWSMENLDATLTADALGLVWGWGLDRQAKGPQCWVLYIELPTGQVSWHTEGRGQGRDFAGAWDGVRGLAPQRICSWVAQVLEGSWPTTTVP